METRIRKKRGRSQKTVEERKRPRNISATNVEWHTITEKAQALNMDTSAFIVKELA